MISNKPKKFICINDTNYYLDFSKFRRELRNALTANLNDEKYIKSVKHINVDDNITVTFTSWKNRINDCIVTINEMLNQTLLPDRIILNLSTEEFPNKEKELSLEELKEQYFIPLYKKANNMIKRYGDVYERIS